MVISCVAYECKNLQDKRFKRHFHSFPFTRPHVLKKWIAAIRRENWEPTRASKLCSDHFKEADYEENANSSLKRLKLDAVPSIFKFPPHVCEQSSCRRKHVLHEPADCVISVDCKPEVMPDNSTLNDHKLALQQVIGSSTSSSKSHCESTTQYVTDSSTFEDSIYEPEVKLLKIIPHGRSNYVDAACSPISNTESETITYLKRKIRTLQQTARRRKKKIELMSSVIQELKKTGNRTETLNSMLEENYRGLSLRFLTHQYRNCARSPQKMKYTDFIKQFSQTLYFYSPRAYRHVSQHFVLPNPRTLRKWID